MFSTTSTIASFCFRTPSPAANYMFKVNRNTRISCEIHSELTIENQNDAGVVLVSLLVTLNTPSVSIVNFEQVSGDWVIPNPTITKTCSPTIFPHHFTMSRNTLGNYEVILGPRSSAVRNTISEPRDKCVNTPFSRFRFLQFNESTRWY